MSILSGWGHTVSLEGERETSEVPYSDVSGSDVSEDGALVFNSALVVHGIPLLTEVLASVDGEGGDGFAELVTERVSALA
ncbi:MAG: hypothetical protein GY811_26105 [Myxococcales bacterium]|nr:hypothetical protein [Myxococcales bacterium]